MQDQYTGISGTYIVDTEKGIRYPFDEILLPETQPGQADEADPDDALPNPE